MRQNLINKRKARKLTQVETAQIIGITVRHYNSIEAGTSDGSVKVWQKISDLFNKPIDYLLEQTVDKQKQS